MNTAGTPLPTTAETTIALPSRRALGADPLPHVADYRFIKPIGRGAFGTVWLAEESLIGTFRAVKVLGRSPATGTCRTSDLIERELQGLHVYQTKAQNHPHLIQILKTGLCSVGEPPADGNGRSNVYYVMEVADHARGSQPHRPADYEPLTLATLLRQRGRLEIDRVIEYGTQLLDAIEHLHKAGIHHRDIKPSNILFVGGAIKLADIGLATSENSEHVGTWAYLPPEGKPSDLYALGKVMYEMLTGLPAAAFPEWPGDLRGQFMRDASAASRLSRLRQTVNALCHPDIGHRCRQLSLARSRILDLRDAKIARTVRLRWVAVVAGVATAAGGLLAAATTFSWFRSGDPTAQRLGVPPGDGSEALERVVRDGVRWDLHRFHRPDQTIAITQAEQVTPIRFFDVQTSVIDGRLCVAGAFQIINETSYPRGSLRQPGGHIAQIFLIAGNRKVLLYHGQPGPSPGVRSRLFASVPVADLGCALPKGCADVCFAFMLAETPADAEIELDRPENKYAMIRIAEICREASTAAP